MTVLEEQEGIKNYSVAVKEDGEEVVFLRKIVDGGADRSYGIHVAKLAGIPDSILKNAAAILHELELEKSAHHAHLTTETIQAPKVIYQNAPSITVNKLAALDLMHITPMEAMQILFDLQKSAQEEQRGSRS